MMANIENVVWNMVYASITQEDIARIVSANYGAGYDSVSA